MGLLAAALRGRRIVSENKRFTQEIIPLPPERTARVVVRAIEIVGTIPGFVVSRNGANENDAIALADKALSPEALTPQQAVAVYGQCEIVFALMNRHEAQVVENMRRLLTGAGVADSPPFAKFHDLFLISKLARRLLLHRIFMTASLSLHDRDYLVAPVLKKSAPIIGGIVAGEEKLREEFGTIKPHAMFEALEELAGEYISTYPSI